MYYILYTYLYVYINVCIHAYMCTRILYIFIYYVYNIVIVLGSLSRSFFPKKISGLTYCVSGAYSSYSSGLIIAHV